MWDRRKPRPAFTITELLAVVAIIILLVGLLTATLSGVWQEGQKTRSMNNLKQVSLWLRQYSTDNSEQIVPSQFNYVDDPYPGKVRSVANIGDEHTGTWTDILWTVFEVSPFAEVNADGSPVVQSYKYDSPDKDFYDNQSDWDSNPLRSSVRNTRQWEKGGLPKPFGPGAKEVGYAGYFAANNFFNADAASTAYNGWYTTGQIKFPAQSMYLVDSFVGEIIEDELEPYGRDPMGQSSEDTIEVDFRYGGDVCLMLFLDGHIGQQTSWDELCDLEKSGGRNVRVRNLTERKSPCP